MSDSRQTWEAPNDPIVLVDAPDHADPDCSPVLTHMRRSEALRQGLRPIEPSRNKGQEEA